MFDQQSIEERQCDMFDQQSIDNRGNVICLTSKVLKREAM